MSGMPLSAIALSVVLAKNLHGNDPRSACTIPEKMAEEISATFEQERI